MEENSPGLTINQPYPTYPIVIMNDDGEDIVRVHSNGNVEIVGDVNEAAMIFWNAVAQWVDGDLIKIAREKHGKKDNTNYSPR